MTKSKRHPDQTFEAQQRSAFSRRRAIGRERHEVHHRRAVLGEGVRLFYFSSFDEPWKLAQEGEVGTQWGLWDKDGRPKYGA